MFCVRERALCDVCSVSGKTHYVTCSVSGKEHCVTCPMSGKGHCVTCSVSGKGHYVSCSVSGKGHNVTCSVSGKGHAQRDVFCATERADRVVFCQRTQHHVVCRERGTSCCVREGAQRVREMVQRDELCQGRVHRDAFVLRKLYCVTCSFGEVAQRHVLG